MQIRRWQFPVGMRIIDRSEGHVLQKERKRNSGGAGAAGGWMDVG